MDQLHVVEASVDRFFAQPAFSVLGPMVREHLATGGKRLRARLALSAAEALGCQQHAAKIAWAGACELMHNATLVHDDLQDGDTVRRGAPTLWVRHGAAQAINAGDLMLMAPMALLHDAGVDDATRNRLCGILVRGMLQVIEGQAQECAMTARGDGTIAHYERMVRGKTAALFALPVAGAAVVAGHDDASATQLAECFAPLGELFQMQDDVLDLWGNKGRGVIGSDIYEGKVSALVVHHLQARPNDRPWLTTLLRTPRQDTTAEQVEQAKARFVASGARSSVLARMRALAALAQKGIDPKISQLMFDLVAQVMAPIAHLDVVQAAS